jgi:hypothetical protein
MQIQEKETMKNLTQFYSSFYQIRMIKLGIKGRYGHVA